MALAEQRARNVKGSVVIREQRHALAKNTPSFSRKIAKLFGWADAGEQPGMSPLQVSPASSRPISPIGSPTAKGGTKMLDDGAAATGYVGTGDVADFVISNAEPPSRLEVQDSSSVAEVGHATGRSSNQEHRRRSSPSLAIDDPMMSHVSDPDDKDCPRCRQLRHELDMAITDRALAEAELVSMRRTISSIGTAWERDLPIGNETKHTVHHESEEDAARKIAPVSPSEITDKDFDLREELVQLEKLASLGGDGVPLSDAGGKVVNGHTPPQLQVSPCFPIAHILFANLRPQVFRVTLFRNWRKYNEH